MEKTIKRAVELYKITKQDMDIEKFLKTYTISILEAQVKEWEKKVENLSNCSISMDLISGRIFALKGVIEKNKQLIKELTK